MRKELEQIERIEQYLQGSMNPQELADFQSELAVNSNLQNLVDIQRELVANVERIGLRSETKTAYKSYLLKKYLIIAGAIIGFITLITVATIMFSEDKNPTKIESQEFSTNVESFYQAEETILDSIETITEDIDSIIGDTLSAETSFYYGVQSNSNAMVAKSGRIADRPFQIYLPESDPLFAEANLYLNQELFELKTDRDTVIESEHGIVIYVPANAFNTNFDCVDFILQEAMTPSDIMYAGLNTLTKDGDTLETGGMFYIDAFANGKRVDLKKRLTVDIPSDPSKTGMQLYDSEKDKANQILWKNPKDFSKPLLPVQITDLDFYPPGYENQMNKWGYLNKKFIDSLYYSFEVNCESNSRNINYWKSESISDSSVVNTINQEQNVIPPLKVKLKRGRLNKDSWEKEIADTTSVVPANSSICGIKPSAIQTIWNKKFNNTNLATKEFESRIAWIHRTCDTDILSLYIDNLDKTLSEVDKMAANLLSGNLKVKFLEFAAMNHGKVETSTTAQKELNAYYKSKQKALQEITKRTNLSFWAKQDSLDKELNRQVANANQREMMNKQSLNEQEIAFNTDRVYKELGLEKPNPRANPLVSFQGASFTQSQTNRPITPTRANRPVLRANITNLGWKNVDCLMSVSMQRTSAQIKGANNLTTSINYSPLSLMVENANKYSKINVYIVPKAFNSFVKLNLNGINYNYSLNDNLTYRTIAIAWSEDGFYVHQNENTTSGRKTLVLEKITKEDWDQIVKNSFSSINGMGEEVNFLEYLKADGNRANTNKDRRDLKRKAEPFVFPCATSSDIEIIPKSNNQNNNKEH